MERIWPAMEPKRRCAFRAVCRQPISFDEHRHGKFPGGECRDRSDLRDQAPTMTARLTFSSRNLADDCATVVPDRIVEETEMEVATVLQRLRAFGAMPAVGLVASDALIYVGNSRVKLAVQHENDRLFATRVPVAVNIAMAQTLDEIVDYLGGVRAVTPLAMAGRAQVGRRSGRRRWLNSRWTAALLGGVALALGYFHYAPEVPAGVAMIHDGKRVAALHTKLNGRYGARPAANNAALIIDSGRISVYAPGADRAALPPVLDVTYRYGERADGQIVLVLANGAVLETGADGSLKFGEAVYATSVER